MLIKWLILTLVLITHAKEYRFDYEFNEQADGWLKFHVIPATWDDARLRCHAEGAFLASPLNNQLKAAIIAFVKKQKNSDDKNGISIHTGVHATFSQGDYSSIEGVPLLRLSITWAPGEPDNYNNSERCLLMKINHNGTMADIQCSDVLPYVCYKKNTLSHTTMNQCGTTDPEYSLEPRTGSCYKFHASGLTWREAYMTCIGEGGYLAVINDELEAAMVRNILLSNSANTLFSNYPNTMIVGFHDWGTRGTSFRTIHGDTLKSTYNQWAAGQPNITWRSGKPDPIGHTEFGGNIVRSGYLDENPTNVPLAFICEKSPDSLR